MNTCKSTVAYIIFFSFIAIFLSSTHVVSGEEQLAINVQAGLVKKNPGFEDKSIVSIDLLMTPQQDNSSTIVIVVSSVGGVIGLLCCVGCFAGLIFFIVRRKASYQQVI